MDAPMETAALPLLGLIEGPRAVPTAVVIECKTYREAVRECWRRRRVHYMTQRQLGIYAGLRAQLVSDYLNPDDKPERRDLPADCIAAFESVCGNRLVSQWLAARSQLTVLEEMQATRAAA
jgi:hypothetical protein